VAFDLFLSQWRCGWTRNVIAGEPSATTRFGADQHHFVSMVHGNINEDHDALIVRMAITQRGFTFTVVELGGG
jgi:hypothetical protein